MLVNRSVFPLIVSVMLIASYPAKVQSVAAQGAAGTVIRTNANLVLVDVVVTSKGKAVRNLQRSQFHVFEDGHEQTIASFDEHNGSAAPVAAPRPAMIPASLPAHTYSNFSADQVASAANVLLLDELNTPQQNREFMRQQMIEYLSAVRPGTRIAVFALTAELRMVQGFTGDASQAIKALESMKHEDFGGHLSGLSKNFQPNFKVHVHPPDQDPITDDRAQTTLLALQQFARLLGLVPGRKNLIWLAGRFPIAFDPGASLSAAQVAVYPVDARGIMSVPGTRVSDLFEAGEAGSMDGDPVIKEQIKAEHAAMENFAEQTGGHAYFLTNGLKEAAVRSVENGSSYYTIGYVPRDEIVDGKLRAIKVHVENGRYELAYRRGYFASSPYHYATHDSGPPSQITKSIVHGAPEATQILFQARILPATDSLLQGTNVPPRPAGEMSRGLKEPVQHMIVDVTVDPHCLDLKNAPEGGHQTQVEFVLVAYDANGERVNYLVRALQVNIKDDSFTRVMDKGVPVRLALDLPPEQVFLRIAVYDLDASSVGSLEVPVMVATR